MGTLTNLNGITEPQIPAAIARDTEVASAIAAHNAADWVHIDYLWRVFLPREEAAGITIASHVAEPDPHPNYLTQPEGDGRYRQTATPLVDGDIPAAIARDAEVASAIASHVSAVDPHPQYPRFFRAIYSSQCPATANQTVSVAHGLAASNIRSFTAFAILYPNTISETRIQPGGVGLPSWIASNCYYSVDIGPSNINIRANANSATVANAPVTIVVDHV